MRRMNFLSNILTWLILPGPLRIKLFAYILLWDKEYLLMVTYGDFPAQNLQVLFARLFTFHFQTFVGHVTVPLNVCFLSHSCLLGQINFK